MSAPNGIPTWLNETPEYTEAGPIRPPVISRCQELPFEELSWKNFERLCYRLASLEADVEHCQLYGNEGDAQEGIDIFARYSGDSKYAVYQCKREKGFGPQKIRKAVERFMSGDWLPKSREFTLCTQESLQCPRRTNVVEEMAEKLRVYDVVLSCWDAPRLNTLLKRHPALVEDFFGTAWRNVFCKVDVQSNESSKSDRAVARKYTRWVSEVTSKFEVPGLSVSIPICDAWVELRVLNDEKDRRECKLAFEKALQNYQEWFRLGEDTRLERFPAEQVYRSETRCVVIGGPGSGKSTLCRRIANQLASKGELIIRVRLKRVLQLVENGSSFSEAVEIESTDGAGLSIKQRHELVQSTTILIADGLDECDPHRSEIAQKIIEWSEGHPNVRVLVSTRPVGHHPSLLPCFRSFELLPLDKDAVTQHSFRLFAAALGAGAESLGKWKAFCLELSEDDRSGKSLASRNPLLLGFLVRLYVDGVEIGSNRCELFGQILQLMAVNPNSCEENSVDPEIAQTVINSVGFELIRNPIQTIDQLVAAVSSNCDITRAADVRAALRFWESSRAVERISAGYLSAVVFIHPSLGEFAAARHVSAFDNARLDDWLRDNVRKPMWRQVVLLASQLVPRIVPRLVELSDTNDPCSIEANIAAEAIAESDCLQEHAKLVSTALFERITSSNPLVAIEATLAIRPIASYLSVGSSLLDERLLEHKFEWTRLCALSLMIHSKTEKVIRCFEEWLQTFTYSSHFFFGRNREPDYGTLPEEAGELQRLVVSTGLPVLLNSRSPSEIERYFRNGRDFCSDVPYAILETIRSNLAAAGCNELATCLNRDYKSPSINFDNINYDTTLVDALTRACGFEQVERANDDELNLFWIKTIVGAIKMGKVPCTDAAYLQRRIGIDEFVEVLKGVIAAVGADYDELKNEISTVIGRIAEGRSLYSIYDESAVEPDWRRASTARLDVRLLESALEHPHGSVSYGAACLLEGGAAGGDLQGLVERTLAGGTHHAVHLAALLLRVAYPVEFLDRAIAKVRSELRPGFEYLVGIVLKDANDSLFASLKGDIAGWLIHADPYFVTHVVGHLKSRVGNGGKSLVKAVSHAFDFWIAKGTWCRDHEEPTHGESCPVCNVCLPSPKAELLSMLAEMDCFTCAELFRFLRSDHRGIQRAAHIAVLNILRRDDTCIKSVLTAIDSGDVPVNFLADVSGLPSTSLMPHKAEFELLLESPKESLRRWALNNLTGAWMPCSDAIAWAKGFIADGEPSMVTAATRILRQLRNQ